VGGEAIEEYFGESKFKNGKQNVRGD